MDLLYGNCATFDWVKMTKKLEHHIEHLKEKHIQLKAESREAYAQGDDILWEKCKKKKLKIKDEIEFCKRKINGRDNH